MPVTKMGNQWESRNSRWLLWPSILGFGYISFIYAGIKVRQVKWVKIGVIYAILNTLTMAVPYIVETYKIPVLNIAANISMMVSMVLWGGSIVYAYSIRTELLLRLEAKTALDNINFAHERELIRQQVAAENGIRIPGSTRVPVGSPMNQGSPDMSSIIANTTNIQTNAPQKPIPVDLNKASVEELQALPGMNLILAKRALDLRASQSCFKNLEDFGEKLGLQPHVIEQLRPMATVTLPSAPEAPTQPAHSSPSHGRIIDY